MLLRREVQRLRGSKASSLLYHTATQSLTGSAGVFTEREQEREAIKELKQKLQESQSKLFFTLAPALGNLI